MFFYRRLIVIFFFILFSCDSNDNIIVDTYSDVIYSNQFNPTVSILDDIDFSSSSSYVNPPHLYSGNFIMNGFYDSEEPYDFNLISIINWKSIPSDICSYAQSDTISLNSVKFYFKYNSEYEAPAYQLDVGISTQVDYEQSSYNQVVSASIDKNASYEVDRINKELILVFDSSIFGSDFNICDYQNFVDCSIGDPNLCDGDIGWQEDMGNGVWDEGEIAYIKDNINIILKNSGEVEVDLYSNEISYYNDLNHLIPYIQYNFENLNTNELDSLIRYGDHKDKYLSNYSNSILPEMENTIEEYMVNYFGNISTGLTFKLEDFTRYKNHVIVDNDFTYLDINLVGPGLQYDSNLDSMQIDLYLTTDATEYITRITSAVYPEDNFTQEPHSSSSPSIRVPAFYIKNAFQNLLNEDINEITFYLKPSGRYNNFQTLYFEEPSLQLVMQR